MVPRHRYTALAGAFAAFGAMLLASPEASADVSAACWAHLAEIPPGETPAGDVRYHRARGEFSPCNEQEAAEASAQKSEDKPDEKKSRHCRKHWYC